MASRYWVGGGANTNWITAGNWSATSGGAGGATVPTSADDVIFNGVGASANGTSTISATITIGSLTYTSGFIGAIVHTQTLSITGNITLHNNYTTSGSAAIVLALGTGTLTSNGRVLTNQLTGAGGATTVTKTLADDWTVNSLVINSNSLTLNGFSMTINTTLSTPSGNLHGTTNIIHNGTSWISTASNTVNNNLTITGTVILGPVINYGTGTLTCITGTMDTLTNETVMTLSNSPTLDIFNSSLFDVILSNSQTITLVKPLSFNSISNTATINVVWAGKGFGTFAYNNAATGACTVTLQEAADVEYYIGESFTANQSRKGSIVHFISSDGTNRAKIHLVTTASCNVLASFTRIEATLVLPGSTEGRIINTCFGTVTDCINVRFYEDLAIVAATF